MTLTETDALAATDSYAGYCKTCDAIVQESGVEPDATAYFCEDCQTQSVVGVEMAVICGYITVEPHDDP